MEENDTDDQGLADTVQDALGGGDEHERLPGEGVNASSTYPDDQATTQVGTTVRDPSGGLDPE